MRRLLFFGEKCKQIQSIYNIKMKRMETVYVDGKE